MKTSTIRQKNYRFRNKQKIEMRLVFELFKEYGDISLLQLYKKIQDDLISAELSKGEQNVRKK